MDPQTLDEFSAVSEPVAREMVIGALAGTHQADIAASVTGHLGPGAPTDQDGLIFVGTGWVGGSFDEVSVREYRLVTSGRRERQVEAASIVLRDLMEALDEGR